LSHILSNRKGLLSRLVLEDVRPFDPGLGQASVATQALIPRKDDVSSEIRSLDVQPIPFPLLQVEWIL